MNMSPSEESAEPVEVYEHIPWAQLAVPTPARKPWVVYLAAGAIAAAALGALVVRSIGRAPEPSVSAAPVTAMTPVAISLPPSPPEEEALSEADLMAVAPGRGEVAASARAEWFVSEYFSTGGDPGSHQGVLDSLPEGARFPEDPPSGYSSYVEWVATSRIEAIGHDRFRSTVLFRVLVSTGGEDYVRLPVRAVDVVVTVDGGGAARVVDLPMPVEVSAGPPVPGWAEPVDEIPDLVRSAALHIGGSWGSEPIVFEGSEHETGWRVVVSVTDEAGLRWPLTVWLTDQGEPV